MKSNFAFRLKSCEISCTWCSYKLSRKKRLFTHVKHSNMYYILGIRMLKAISSKKTRLHIWYELMFKWVSRWNIIQSRGQVISSHKALSSRVTITFRVVESARYSVVNFLRTYASTTKIQVIPHPICLHSLDHLTCTNKT